MTEEIFHNHICKYLKNNFGYRALTASDLADKEYYFGESHLVEFVLYWVYEVGRKKKNEPR